MTVADKPHGRTRHNPGCRCGTCKQANRDHQRQRRAKYLTPVPPGEKSPPPEVADGPVTEAVRAQFHGTAVALERPALYAIAIRLAQLLDRDDCAPQYASASHRLTQILGTLAQSLQCRGGRLAAVRDMTGRRD